MPHRLQYPTGFPYELVESVGSIRETMLLKVTPAGKADYPPVDIETVLRTVLTARVPEPA